MQPLPRAVLLLHHCNLDTSKVEMACFRVRRRTAVNRTLKRENRAPTSETNTCTWYMWCHVRSLSGGCIALNTRRCCSRLWVRTTMHKLETYLKQGIPGHYPSPYCSALVVVYDESQVRRMAETEPTVTVAIQARGGDGLTVGVLH